MYTTEAGNPELMFMTRKVHLSQVGKALRSFIAEADKVATPAVQQKIRQDPYVIGWLWTFAKMTQEKELERDSKKDPIFATEATQYALEVPIETVNQGIAHWTSKGLKALKEARHHPFNNAASSYIQIKQGEAMDRNDPLFIRLRSLLGVEKPVVD